MTDERQVEQIFHQAAALPPDHHDSFLADRCGDDAELRSLVEQRLRDHVEKGLEGSRSTQPLGRSGRSRPTQIGPYRLLEKIGEGGFGEVYAAEQDQPVKRRVALKILKAGMDTKAVLARFEAERQALALMDHPHIAKVLDAGQTPHGRPYFVMELIQGERITAYCDRHRFTMRQRLELFLPVCAAIQHAHQKSVIHRDIKPGNVLITNVDGKPTPKVIDFGIAKATAASLTDKTLYTLQGQIIGTPAYMSPEQAEMTGLNVDTRTDVYSLGVLLYELLTGTLPFDTKTLREAGIEAMRRIIREKEPPKPSTRISSLGGEAKETAARRRSEPARLTKLVRGELDWITMKSLEKDPGRRYETVNGLAADVGRYLADEPVRAHPPSKAYRLQKLVKRNKLPTAFAVTVTTLLVGLAVTMNVLRGEAETARADAEARAEELQRVTEFQSSMLSEIDAEAMGAALVEDFRERVRESLGAEGITGEEVESDLATFEETLRRVNATDAALTLIDEQVLKRAVETIEGEFADRPVTRAALQQTVADTYKAIGLYPQAVPLQEAALSARRRALGEEHPETLESIGNMGSLLESMGKFDDALPYYEEALKGNRRVHGADHLSTLTSIANMGYLLESMGKFDDALPYYEEALEGGRRVLGNDDPNTLIWISSMGGLISSMGRLDEALPYFEEALEGRRRVLGRDHPSTLASVNNMGHLLRAMGRPDEALPYHQEALEGARRVLGGDHPNTLSSMNNMGVLLKSMGRLDEALPYYEEALEARRRVLGDDHPSTVVSLNNMGSLLRSMGKLDEALPYYEEALESGRRVLGDDHPSTLVLLNNMGLLLRSMGKLDEALPYYEEALEGGRRVLGDDHRNTLLWVGNMGALRFDRGEPAEAVALLVSAEADARKVFTEGNSYRLGRFLTVLGRSRTAIGAFGEAEADLTEALQILEGAANAEIEDRAETLKWLAVLHEAWHTAEPEAHHDASAERWRAKLAELQAVDSTE